MENIENVKVGDETKNKKATAGLILGIVGLIAWIIPIVGAPVISTGLTLSVKGLKSLRRGAAIAGIILCSFGLLLTIANAALGAYMGATGQNPLVNKITGKDDASQNAPANNVDAKKQAYIDRVVEEAKSEMTLPSRVDDITTIVDITSETGAIRYHYESFGIDSSKITNELLKKILVDDICKDKDTKMILDQDINMEFEYTIKDSTDKFFVSITKADCDIN